MTSGWVCECAILNTFFCAVDWLNISSPLLDLQVL